MTKKQLYGKLLAVLVGGLLVCSACHHTDTSGAEISLEKMNGFPSGNAAFLKGVSALYAGITEDRLIMAGGCNFPDIPVADGGKKVFYNEVYATPLSLDTAFRWKQVGFLPVASAYGVTISTQKGLICVGGTTADGSISDVFLLSLQEDVLVTDTLPSLPMTIDNMAGALIGDLLYIVGGNVNGVPSADMYSLDLSNMDKGWQKEPGVPGEPRVQPVCAAQGGKLYVWGGFAPAADGREATLSVDGYVYSPETRVWTSVATPVDKEGKSISLGGGAAVPWGEEAILCIGGVNKDIFLKALQGIYSGKEYLSHPAEWYQFNKNLLLYYPAKDEWSSLGEYEQGARAGAALVADGVYAYIINGELKPGIRTNEINRIKENRK